MNLYDIIKEILIDVLEVDSFEVTLEADIINDLGADSLDIVEIGIALECELNIDIEDDEWEVLYFASKRESGTMTVRNVLNFLKKQLMIKEMLK